MFTTSKTMQTDTLAICKYVSFMYLCNLAFTLRNVNKKKILEKVLNYIKQIGHYLINAHAKSYYNLLNTSKVRIKYVLKAAPPLVTWKNFFLLKLLSDMFNILLAMLNNTLLSCIKLSLVGNILRQLDSFDCHKVVFATFSILAETFTITLQYKSHINMTQSSAVEKFGW